MPTKRKAAKKVRAKAARLAKAKASAKPKRKTLPSAKRKAARPAAQPAPMTRKRPIPATMQGILHPGLEPRTEPEFLDAPDDWAPEHARALAAKAGLTLTEDHWEVIRVLQGCYKDEVSPRIRLLRDALEARFASKGGVKYLFGILPGGPIVQGCVLAGLKPPPGARDLSFGSVA